MAINLNMLKEIPIDLAIKIGDTFNFDCYLKLSNEKIIKIGHKNDGTLLDIFIKYEAKGVKSIFVDKDDALNFLKSYKESLSEKVLDPNISDEKKVQTLSDCFDFVRNSFVTIGLQDTVIEAAQELAVVSLKMIKDIPNLQKFFKSFRERCSDQFEAHMMTSYTASIMLEQFDWTTPEIKKKISIAGILCDITLSDSDFKLIDKHSLEPEKLPEHIYNHPKLVAEFIRTNKHLGVATDVAGIIEQHHEQPDGSGFPGKLDHKRITLFSAVYIVASDFIREIQRREFDYTKVDMITNIMSQKYGNGNFKKATRALIETLS